MIEEQPGLFEESSGVQQEQQLAEPEGASYLTMPFLPGTQDDDAYKDIHTLSELEDLAGNCQDCRLRETCQRVVFGEGPGEARIMFIGEGPGQEEDIQGKPFVGRAGQLLDKMLAASDFKRNEVYICNVVKCRPPGNRIPKPDEVKQCRRFLEAQIRIIHPAIIVCLGSLASQVVIDSRARITKVRGKWLSRQGIKIMASFHPAALLRNEAYKRPAWEDFKQIRDEYKRLKL